MNRELLLVVACVACLLAVAAALPAADPRTDTSGGGDWDTVRGSGDDTGTDTDPTGPDESDSNNDSDDSNDSSDSNDSDGEPRIEIAGPPVPGTEVTIEIRGTDDDERTVHTPVSVDGEQVSDNGTADYTVPFRASFQVTAPEADLSENVAVETDASIATTEPHLPGRTTDVNVTVDSTRIPDATVRVAGDPVATTDENGTATVPLPAEGEVTNLSVERGAVSGTRTIDLAELDVEFTSLVVLPGLPGEVKVAADGVPVENATVSVDGDTARTGGTGNARLWLPVSDAVTVNATAGAASTSASASGLYLRLTAVVLIVPSLVIGLAAAILRVAPVVLSALGVDERQGGGAGELFFAFGGFLSGLVALLSASRVEFSGLFARRGSRSGSWSWSLSLPSLPSWPELNLPRFSGGLPSVGSVDGLLSRGSLGSKTGTTDASGDAFDTGDGSGTAESERTPEERIGRRWHVFVAQLGIDRPETLTPGQVTRRALAAGYPAGQVRSLVETFRAVEYGGRAATRDRVERVRETYRSLREHDPESGEES